MTWAATRLLPRLRRRGLLGEQPDHRDQDAKERDFFHVRLSTKSLTDVPMERDHGGTGSAAWQSGGKVKFLYLSAWATFSRVIPAFTAGMKNSADPLAWPSTT